MSGGNPTLDTINETTGAAPRSVIADGTSAHAIKRRLIDADIPRSRQRAVIKAMYDGHPPFDPSKLRNLGQGDRSNINFKRAKAMTDQQADSYLDLQFETPDFCTVATEVGISSTRSHDFSQILTDEFNRLIRRWKGFYDVMAKSNFNRVYYGAGPVYFDSASWRPLAADAGQVFVDKNADTDISKVDVLQFKRIWRLHELYRKIEDPAIARRMGWDVLATRKAIVRAANNNEQGKKYNNQIWEELNNRIKSNDIYFSYVSPGCIAYDLLTVEYDRTISQRTLTDWDSPDVLCTKMKVAKEFKELVCPFFLSKQESLWHQIRGLGAQFYNVLRSLDQIDNQILDMTLIGGSLVIQPATAAAYDKLNTIRLGPVTVLPPNVELKPVQFPNLSQGGIITHNMLMATLSQTTGEFQASTESTNPGEAPTATQVNANLATLARLSSSQQNQFYNELDNCYLQMFKRAASMNLPDASSLAGKSEWCREARLFQKRCLDRGVPLSAMQEPYLQAVTSTRALGHGSPAMRAQQANDLVSMLPLVPNQQARTLIIKDVFTAKFGSQVTHRYFPAIPGRQLREDAKTAELENGGMQDGHPYDVMDFEDAVTHLGIHLPLMAQTAQSLTQAQGAQGQAPDMGAIAKVYGFLAIALPHCSAHLQTIAGDPTQKGFVQQAVNLMRQLNSTATHLQYQLKTAASAAQRASVQQSTEQVANAQKMQLESGHLALATRKQAHKEKMDTVDMALKIAQAQKDLHLDTIDASIALANAQAGLQQSQTPGPGTPQLQDSPPQPGPTP